MDIDTPVLAMDWLPGKGASEILALACSDGSFKLVSKAGRVEKNVSEAHLVPKLLYKTGLHIRTISIIRSHRAL